MDEDINVAQNGDDSGNELKVDIPPDVVKAIQEIFPSDDPFGLSTFNAVSYINELFPTEQSLHRIDDVLGQMRVKISSVDEEIRTVIRSLTNVEQDGRTSLLSAQEAIAELFSRFEDIRERASDSEERVREITRDIKQLDIAKRNLTTSITTLNHLQMLVEGVDKLSTLKIKREYGEIATLLQGVSNVMEHLSKHKHIPQVADLSGQVEQIKRDLEKQIFDDFSSALQGRNAKRLVVSQELAEACLVVSVLHPRVKKSIMDDVIKSQLAEYDVLYSGSETDGGLNKVELRRKWFLKVAIEFEKTLAAMFPPSWQVPGHLAFSFCIMTSGHLRDAMKISQDSIDVATLLSAHKILSELEVLLSRKYVTFTESSLKEKTSSEAQDPTPSSDAAANNDSSSPFIGSICQCFVPFLHIYLQNVDKRFGEQIDKFSSEMKSYKFEQIDTEASNVVPFCGELFTIYKNILVEFLHLGSGHNLSGLAEVMQKNLKEFGVKVLRAALPRLGANYPNVPKDLKMKELTAVLAQVQTFWREGDSAKLTEDEVRKVCSILVSSEYCEEMTGRLEAKLKEKLTSGFFSVGHKGVPFSSSQPSTVGVISLATEQDLFHAILTESIALLVAHVETQCDAALTAMTKVPWTLTQTGDQSSYVSSIAQIVSSTVPLVRHNLHSSRKYFTRFCDKLASNVIHKFSQQIYKCRPVNSVGCEQLLLDSHALKVIILNLPTVGSQVQREPPQAYTRMVNRVMSRAELLLQVVMGEYNSNTDLVNKFVQVLPDASQTDFQKVLDMRGVKDKGQVLEAYRRKVNAGVGSSQDPLKQDVTSISLPTTTAEGSANNPSSPEKEGSKIARLEKMLKSKRLLIS